MSEIDSAAVCCMVCAYPYDEGVHCPRILFCGHTLCTECLSRTAHLACPYCKTGYISGYAKIDVPKNFALIELLSNLSPARRKVVSRCDVHNEPFQLYDMDCAQLVCLECITADDAHKGHNHVKIKDACVPFRKELEAAMTKCTDRAKELRDAERICQDQIMQYAKKEDVNATAIRRYFREIKLQIVDKEEKILSDLAKRCDIDNKYFRSRADVYMATAGFLERASAIDMDDVEVIRTHRVWLNDVHHAQTMQIENVPEVVSINYTMAPGRLMQEVDDLTLVDDAESCMSMHAWISNNMKKSLNVERFVHHIENRITHFNLTHFGGEANYTILTNAVIEGMVTHPDNAQIQLKGCCILEHITAHFSPLSIYSEKRIDEVIVPLLKTHQCSECVKYCCLMLRRRRDIMISRDDIIDLIVAAMGAYENNQFVQYEACMTLHYCCISTELPVHFAKVCVPAILFAMKAHSAKVFVICCQILTTLLEMQERYASDESTRIFTVAVSLECVNIIFPGISEYPLYLQRQDVGYRVLFGFCKSNLLVCENICQVVRQRHAVVSKYISQYSNVQSIQILYDFLEINLK